MFHQIGIQKLASFMPFYFPCQLNFLYFVSKENLRLYYIQNPTDGDFSKDKDHIFIPNICSAPENSIFESDVRTMFGFSHFVDYKVLLLNMLIYFFKAHC